MSGVFAVAVSESTLNLQDTVLVEADRWVDEGSWVKFYQGSAFVSAFANRTVLRVTNLIDAPVASGIVINEVHSEVGA